MKINKNNICKNILDIFNKIFRFFFPKGGYKKAFEAGIIIGKQASIKTGQKLSNKKNKNKNKN